MKMSESDLVRRQFIGLLGGAAATSMGAIGIAGGQEGRGVSVGNNYFDPIGLYVEPGTTVRFEIESGSHSVTAYENRIPPSAAPFDSGVLSQGEFEYTFETLGTYDYYCIPHESMGMIGRIVVGEPGGPAEESPISEGDVPESEMIVEQGIITLDEFGGADDNRRGRMMKSESGMMTPRSGWMMLLPLGFVTALFGSIGGVAYWLSRKARSR